MKTRIILSLVMLLTVLSVKAQEPVETKIFPTNQIISPHKIEVTFQKTVHILFPSEVKYVDLGSFDIIADKATGAENVVRIKAAVKGFEGETNFSVICEELGLFGAICLILLYLLIIWRFMVIANNAADLYGALLVVGIMAHISIQVVLNIAVVTNTIPNTGISLPFVSYGGTSILFLLSEMGLALSVSRGIKFEVT